MTLAEQIELACLMEATARKPGNVHCAASFDDLCYDDFVRAATASAQPLADAQRVGLGTGVFNAVQATRAVTGTNVNLGIALLLAPLAAVPATIPLEQGISQILNETTIDDAEQVYAAIRLAQPGGMGEAASQDIRDRPTVTLRDAMALAVDRDRIAEQYVTDFRLVFQARTKLRDLMTSPLDWETAIITLQLWILSQWPDTLIARKCGPTIANEASQRASSVLKLIESTGNIDQRELEEFDRWLRSDGHRRNPGTTADLIAAVLFAAMRDDLIRVPSRIEVLEFAGRKLS